MTRAVLAGFGVAALLLPSPVPGQQAGAGVAATVHNLSASGPGEIKAQAESEVCKFCHVPHNPVAPVPLWSHTLSPVASYAVPTLSRGRAAEVAPQPDGSSRLCLSCHDGTVALGDIARANLPMAGAQRLARGRRSHLGTDLSGSHPISIPLPEGGALAMPEGADMALKPRSAVMADGAVKLDAAGKVQCTTCHDPHQDRYYEPGRVPRFWVRPTVTEVCLACHEPR